MDVERTIKLAENSNLVFSVINQVLEEFDIIPDSSTEIKVDKDSNHYIVGTTNHSDEHPTRLYKIPYEDSEVVEIIKMILEDLYPSTRVIWEWSNERILLAITKAFMDNVYLHPCQHTYSNSEVWTYDRKGYYRYSAHVLTGGNILLSVADPEGHLSAIRLDSVVEFFYHLPIFIRNCESGKFSRYNLEETNNE